MGNAEGIQLEGSTQDLRGMPERGLERTVRR